MSDAQTYENQLDSNISDLKRIQYRLERRVANDGSTEDNILNNVVGEMADIVQRFVSDYDEGKLLLLPAAVGDTVYKLCTVNTRIEIGDLHEGRRVENNCHRCEYRSCPCYNIGLREHTLDTFQDFVTPRKLESLHAVVDIIPYWGTIFFATEQDAQNAIQKHRDSNEVSNLCYSGICLFESETGDC